MLFGRLLALLTVLPRGLRATGFAGLRCNVSTDTCGIILVCGLSDVNAVSKHVLGGKVVVVIS